MSASGQTVYYWSQNQDSEIELRVSCKKNA